jgi:hypothetical protein
MKSAKLERCWSEMKRAAHIIAALSLAAACQPAASERDDAPAPAAVGATAPGELAGGPSTAQQIILPGVMNIAAPIDAVVVNSCEKVVAADYDEPPAMACVIFVRDGEPAEPDAAFDRVLDDQLVTAGWTLVRSAGAQHYFEHAKPGMDCADLSVFTALDAAQLDRLLKGSKAGAAPAGTSWRGYSIPATIRETCGADRMRP